MAEGQPGSWWALLDIHRWAEQEFEAYNTRPPVACPDCGEPLINGPSTDSGSGIQLYCKFDGWTYPRDWRPAQRMT